MTERWSWRKAASGRECQLDEPSTELSIGLPRVRFPMANRNANKRPVTDIRERPLSRRLYHAAKLFWASYASWTSLLHASRCFSSTRCPSVQR
jgi:hypothetical protein